MPLRHCCQRIDDPAPHKPEVACVSRDWHCGQAREKPIKEGSRSNLEKGLTLTPYPLTKHDVRSFFVHCPHHGTEQLWRILQVGIEEEHAVSARKGKAGTGGGLVPMVSHQSHTHDVMLMCGEALNHIPGPVARSVIYKYNLVALGAHLSARANGPAMKFGQNVLLVEARSDN